MRRAASRSGLLLSALAIAVTAFGCSDGGSKPLPTVHHPHAAVPQDRDAAGVTAALNALDPCDLLDPAAARSALIPAELTPVPRGPHRCELEIARGSDDVNVTIDTPLSARDRFMQEPLILAGHKAYLSRQATMCRLAIPVSFTRAIEVRADLTGPRYKQCRQLVTRFGTAAVGALESPHRTNLPLSRWESCTLLREALPAGRRSFSHGNFTDGMDRCDAISKGESTPDYYLDFEYGDDPGLGGADPVRTIGGHRTRIYSDPQCNLSWSEGTTGIGKHNSANVTLVAPDCTQAENAAVRAMDLLSGPPPATPAPQGPLTYAADQPDVAAAGACVDLPTYGTCEPYRPVTAPHGGKELLRHIAADPYIRCAVAVDAVRKHLGAEFKPVIDIDPVVVVDGKRVADSRCTFVEPTHSIRFSLDTDEGVAPDTSLTTQKVAGHPVLVKDGDPIQHAFIIALGEGPPDGEMSGTLQVTAPRGTDDADRNVGVFDKLEPIMTDIVTKYL